MPQNHHKELLTAIKCLLYPSIYSWIKEQETFLTRILVKNNVVPLALGDYVIAGK
jgi:hypothetical protein